MVSGPIISWQIDRGKTGNNDKLYFLGLQNHCRLQPWNSKTLAPWKESYDISFVVQWLSHVRLFVTPWTAARQASLFFTISWSLLKLMAFESWCHPTISSSVVPFSCLHSFPTSGSFLMSQLLASSGQSIGASASASVLPMNIQDWFPLGLTGLISLQLFHTDLKFCAYFVNFLSSLTLSRNSFMGRSKGWDVPGIVLLLTSKP